MDSILLSLATAVFVLDGDSLLLSGVNHRLEGIDAPEIRQTCRTSTGAVSWCGLEAAKALRRLVAGKPVRCRIVGRDRYRRPLAQCWVGTIHINAWLVRRGYAVAYRRYSKAFIPHEDAARRERLGLWAGTFEMPWAWRAKIRIAKRLCKRRLFDGKPGWWRWEADAARGVILTCGRRNRP